jgi:hypothetical protein
MLDVIASFQSNAFGIVSKAQLGRGLFIDTANLNPAKFPLPNMTMATSYTVEPNRHGLYRFIQASS